MKRMLLLFSIALALICIGLLPLHSDVTNSGLTEKQQVFGFLSVSEGEALFTQCMFTLFLATMGGVHIAYGRRTHDRLILVGLTCGTVTGVSMYFFWLSGAFVIYCGLYWLFFSYSGRDKRRR